MVLDGQILKACDLDQNKIKLSVYDDYNLISTFEIDMLNIYYQAKHCLENKWLGMNHPKHEPNKIRSIMKISAQLIGPDDDQSKLELDISDLKSAKASLMLPPQMNPEV